MQTITTAARLAFETSPVKRKYKCFIDWITKGDTPGVVTAGEFNSTYFPKANVANGEDYTPYKPFILSDSMRLGDNVRLVSNKYENGWMGANRSDAYGVFTPNAEVISMIYTDAVSTTHLTVFGSQYNYPFNMDLYYRDATNTNWILCQTYTGLTNYITVYTFPSLTTIKGWKVEITRINLANMFACIVEVTTGFREDVTADLTNDCMEITKELEYSGASVSLGNISANTLRLRLNNTTQKYNPENVDSYLYPYLKYNKIIQPFIGIDLGDSIEWFAQGKYYVREITPKPDMTVEIYAVDRMFFLNNKDFDSSLVYENHTKSELVTHIVDDFGIGAAERSIDTTTDIIPYAYFTPRKYAEDIKRLEISDGGVAFFDELGKFNSKTRGWTETGAAAYYDDSNIKKDSASSPTISSSMKNYIRIKSNPLYEQVQEVVYNLTQTISVPAGGTKTFACYFNTKPCLDVVNATFTQSGGGGGHITITTESKYSFATFLTFSNSAGVAENVLTIEIQAKPLEATGANEVIAQDSALIDIYGKSEYEIDSEFIQNMTRAQELADDLLVDYKDPEALELEIETISKPYIQLGDIANVKIKKLSIADSKDYIYCAGAQFDITGSTKVWKINKANMSKAAESLDYGGAIYALTEDSSYVYAGGGTTNKVYKYLKSDLSKVAETLGYGGLIDALAEDTLYIYAGGYTTQKVYKYLKSDMSKEAESSSYGGDIWTITSDDLYIYAGGNQGVANKVYKYQKSDMSKVSESADYGCWITALTQDNNYIYCAGSTVDGVASQKVWKILKSDMSKVAESIGYGSGLYALTNDTSYVYCGGRYPNNTVWKILKSDMSKILESPYYGDSGSSVHALAEDTTYIYAGGGGAISRVQKIKKSDMTKILETADYGQDIFALSNI